MLRALVTMGLIACAGDTTTDSSSVTETVIPDPSVTDSFPQTLLSPVDMLWVVDPGWDEGLAALDDALIDDAFHLYLLADPSWRLGVLNASATGTEFGLIGSVIETWPRANPVSGFLEADARVEPRYREALYTALDLRIAEGDNEDFLRSDAHLYVVYLGARPDATSDDQLTVDAFESWFAKLNPSDSKRLAVLTDLGAADYWSSAVSGGGSLFAVGTMRDEIMKLFLESMNQRTSFPLTQPALEAPLVATVIYRNQRTDYAIDRDFTYDPITNAITFIDYVPPPESTIEVTYVPATGVGTATTTPTTLLTP